MTEGELLLLLQSHLRLKVERPVVYEDREQGRDLHSVKVTLLWGDAVVCEGEAI